MKAVLGKITSLFMAFLVVFSTMSFTINMHFCGDVLVDVSVFTKTKKCGMESLEVLPKKTCCKVEVDVIQGQDELKFSNFEDFDFHHQPFLTAFTFYYLIFFEGVSEQIIPHKDYSPPKLVADLQVLDQVFII